MQRTADVVQIPKTFIVIPNRAGDLKIKPESQTTSRYNELYLRVIGRV